MAGWLDEVGGLAVGAVLTDDDGHQVHSRQLGAPENYAATETASDCD